MKIKGDKQRNTRPGWLRRKLSKRSFRIKLWILGVLLVTAVAGSIVASRMLRTKGYSGLWDFLETTTSNYYHSFSASPEHIDIDIKPEDYSKLETAREKALERGMIANEEGSFVPAVIKYKGRKIKVKLRLKGHMTDHIESDKWSFRIKVKDNDSFMGMRLFSIQHPGTRGYAYEWIYHQMMKREDIIALRYTFIDVSVNGKDLGIYAVEENFDKELIENNERKPGPIMRFNPDMYWVDRYNELAGNKPNAEYASYQSANLEPYRDDKVLGDSVMRGHYLKALGLMEGFRRGKLRVDEVFDVKRLARFHAIIDLVGGHHSLDWSDLKYYYNPLTDRLEPVAYESFTILPARELSGMYRFVDMNDKTYRDDFHTTLFSNEVFFREYIHCLERVSQPQYLDTLFSEIDPQLKENLAILNKEFPYKKFDKSLYYTNQFNLRRMLDIPRGLHAYYEGFSGDVLHLKVGSIDALPVEIKGLSIDSKPIASASVVLPCKKRLGYVEYKDVDLKLLPGVHWSDSLLDKLVLNYSVLGASQQKHVNVYTYPYEITDSLSNALVHISSTIGSFPFFKVNNADSTIIVMPGSWKIASPLVIPAGYVVKTVGSTTLDIRKGGSIVSYSPFDFHGNEDEPVNILSGDSAGTGIALIATGKPSSFRYVSFTHLAGNNDKEGKMTGGITFYEAPVNIDHCIFSSSRSDDGVNIVRSGFTVANSLFTRMRDDALDIDFSNGNVNNCSFEECGENALDITMGSVSLAGISVNGCNGKALNLKAGANISGKDIRIMNAGVGVSAEDLSDAALQQLMVSNAHIALVAFRNKPGSGPASIKVNGMQLVKVATSYVVEKRSSITIDGKEVQDKAKDVEKTVRNATKSHP